MNIVQNNPQEPFYFQCEKNNITGRGLGPITFYGLEMTQNQNAVIVWDTFFKYLSYFGEVPARVIELGTGSGGFSVLLYLYCQSVEAEFVTYDLPDRGEWSLKHKFPGIDYRLADVHDSEVISEIGKSISSEGLTVLLCDSSKKEWNHLAPYLKVGDYIAAHDYAPDEKYFWDYMAMQVWSFLYIQDSDIEDSCTKYHLEPCLPEMFLLAGWVCKKRVE